MYGQTRLPEARNNFRGNGRLGHNAPGMMSRGGRGPTRVPYLGPRHSPPMAMPMAMGRGPTVPPGPPRPPLGLSRGPRPGPSHPNYPHGASQRTRNPPGIPPRGPPPGPMPPPFSMDRFPPPFPPRGPGGGPRPGPHFQPHRPPPDNSRKRSHNFTQGSQSKPKKIKVDKRDLPENNKFYCDTCDRGYKDESKYREHVDGHVKCHGEGCNYVAAAKLVKLHYDTQHRSGLAKKIWQLESKDDIEKWKAERRKNFPTASNIARKQQEYEERKARGEVLDTKTFGKMRGRGRGHDSFRGRGRGRGGRGSRGRNRQKFSDFQDEKHSESLAQVCKTQDSNATNKTELKPQSEAKHQGDPLSYLLPSHESSDEDETKRRTATGGGGVPQCAGALGSLVASYAESSSEGESEEKGNTVQQQTTAQSDPKASGPRSKPSRPETPDSSDRYQNSRRERRKKNKQSAAQQQTRSRSINFLEKLLAPDIRHERNVVLQCIRHIVKNDFFGATSNAATDSTSTVSSNSVNRPTGTPSDDMNHLEAAEKAESVSMETTSIETTDQAVPVSSETVERPELASAKDKQRVAESPTKDCLTDAEAASVESSTDPKTYSTDNSSPGRELNRTLSRDDEEIWENGVV